MKNNFKVILVDDDEDILWINQLILEEVGYSVDVSNDPEEALKRVISEDYNVAVLDYMMPKMRGDELAERILKHDNNIRIIFLTGYAEFVSYMETVGNCNNVILLKPISEKELIDAVNFMTCIFTDVSNTITYAKHVSL